MQDFLESDLMSIQRDIKFISSYDDNLEEPVLEIFPEYEETLAIDKALEELNLYEKEQTASRIFGKIKKSSFNKRKYTKKNKPTCYSQGKWTLNEENLYHQFITEFNSRHPSWITKDISHKRMNYFKEMSCFIRTRSPEQCRSHDQKMRSRYIPAENAQLNQKIDDSPANLNPYHQLETTMNQLNQSSVKSLSINTSNLIPYLQPLTTQTTSSCNEFYESTGCFEACFKFSFMGNVYLPKDKNFAFANNNNLSSEQEGNTFFVGPFVRQRIEASTFFLDLAKNKTLETENLSNSLRHFPHEENEKCYH